MSHNQTHVISVIQAMSSAGMVTITTQVNNFITSGIANGYINFHVLPVVVVPQTVAGGVTTEYGFVAQINYYDPSIM